MIPSLTDLLSVSYLIAGFAFAAVYVPRVRRMLDDDLATARSHSVCAEALWALCRLVTLAYVATVAAQPLISLAVSLELAGRLAVLIVLLRARARCGVLTRFA